MQVEFPTSLFNGGPEGRAANYDKRGSTQKARPSGPPLNKILIAILLIISAASPLLADLHPYTGISIPGVDRNTLAGKIMCGYQGWFTTPADGSGKGWTHYESHDQFEPGFCNIDLWPDVTELDPDEKYLTPFKLADGSAAAVFSSHNPKTVLRHFKWMKQYGIDGVFVQRFIADTLNPLGKAHCNVVLDSCRAGANQNGRVYALMYDLSGLKANSIDRVIDDWKTLVDQMQLTRDDHDKAYLIHTGKPVVAVWGIGFNDHRNYTLADCRRLVEFLKGDPRYGNNTVMIGVPTGWRTLNGDAAADPALLDLADRADIISPWTVGRYNSPDSAKKHADQHWAPDLAWCAQHHKDYMPVVFPGFSWHNMHVMLLPPHAVSRIVIPNLNQIPRLGGEFQWSQYAAAKSAGAMMIYQAMFDEMDEGTAIFKITNNPPVGKSQFVTLDGLPTDHYLWLAGEAGKLLRGEIPVTDKMPARE